MMEHKEIELYLVEYSDDAVDKTIRPLIKKHIEVCDSCQDQLKVIQHVRDIISTHGNAIFEDHPLSSDLASFSIRENQLTAEEMAVIGIHLQHCPTCMYEVGISQKALSDAKKTEDGCVLFEKYTMRWKRVALVAAVLALALLYPAWRGIQSEDVYSGGGVEVLYVCETTRDASDLPSVSVQPGQQFLPVM
ncbi:hypothetical protein HOD41_08550, partial [bacterium]|nr:hypothetical protein [bacterium]